MRGLKAMPHTLEQKRAWNRLPHVKAKDKARDKLEHRKAKQRERSKKWYEQQSSEYKRKLVEAWNANRLKVLESLAGRSRPDVCDICATNPFRKPIAFDHSHKRGHFRGWLCGRCNVTLGYVEDDVQLLRKMIAYLERHAENHSPQLTIAGI